VKKQANSNHTREGIGHGCQPMRHNVAEQGYKTGMMLGSSVRCEKLLNAWAWIHADVRGGVRLIQRSTILKTML
jgi:hypothetical protein